MKNIPVLPLARRYRLRMLGLFLVVSWAVLTVVKYHFLENLTAFLLESGFVCSEVILLRFLWNFLFESSL